MNRGEIKLPAVGERFAQGEWVKESWLQQKSQKTGRRKVLERGAGSAGCCGESYTDSPAGLANLPFLNHFVP